MEWSILRFKFIGNQLPLINSALKLLVNWFIWWLTYSILYFICVSGCVLEWDEALYLFLNVLFGHLCLHRVLYTHNFRFSKQAFTV